MRAASPGSALLVWPETAHLFGLAYMKLRAPWRDACMSEQTLLREMLRCLCCSFVAFGLLCFLYLPSAVHALLRPICEAVIGYVDDSSSVGQAM